MSRAEVVRARVVPFVGLLVLSSTAAAGPITSNTALPVHDGELILRQQAIWLR